MRLIRSTNYGAAATVPSLIDWEANSTGSPSFTNLAHSAGKLAVVATQRASATPPSLDAADITDGWTVLAAEGTTSSIALFGLRCTSSAHPTPVFLNETDLRHAWCFDGDFDTFKHVTGTGPAMSWGGAFTTAPNVIVGGYLRYGTAVTNILTALPSGYTSRGTKNSAAASGLGFDSDVTLLSSPTLPAVSNLDTGTGNWRGVLFSIKGVGM